jgi:type VI protein secretion system component Hcp
MNARNRSTRTNPPPTGETLEPLGDDALRAVTGARAALSDFHFVKKTDKASPVLLKACTSGTHIPEVVIVS